MSAKRPTRRDFLKAAVGTVGAGILVACGASAGTSQTGDVTQGPAGGAAQAPSESTPAPVAGGAAQAPSESTPAPVAGGAAAGGQLEAEGVLWGLQYDPHVAAYQRLADFFQKQTGSTLRVEPQSGDLVAKFIAALSAGTHPDVYCLIGKSLVPLHLQKVLMPLGESVFQAKGVDPKTAFIGDAVQAYSWQNEIWGVPVEANAVGSSVNVPVDEVKALGLQDKYPPTNGQTYFESYDDMWALAGQLQKKEGDQVTRWGISSKGWESVSLLGMIRSQGVKWWDLDAKKFNINTEAGIEALKLLVETPVKMGIETELEQNHLDAALAGKVALARANPTVSTQAGELGYTYEVTGVPRIKPGEDPLFIGEGGWGFIAPKQAQRPGISLAFLQMMASTEAQLEYAKIYDGLPFIAWAELKTDTSRFKDGPDSAEGRAAELFEKLLPQTEFYGEQFGSVGEIQKATGEVCSELRQGKIDATAAAQQLQERYEAQYQQYLEDAKQG